MRVELVLRIEEELKCECIEPEGASLLSRARFECRVQRALLLERG